MKLFLVVLFVARVTARKGFGPGEQEWGFSTVRPGADMFWWLHYTTANVKNYTDRPLIVWLQGGPGSSSTGYGNFAELGPLDVDLNPRNFTWVKDANVMFVDNPVGTGWSFVKNHSSLTTTNRQIANDFVVMMQDFYRRFPEFKKVPFYIVSESYGGKMAAEISLVLDEAIKAGKIESNFIGVGLGDSWISPIDSVLTWAPFLLHAGAIDQEGYNQIMIAANRVKTALNYSKFIEATSEWGNTQTVTNQVTHKVDWYNILAKIRKTGKEGVQLFTVNEDDSKITALMNGPVKQALNLIGSFNSPSTSVVNYLAEDFMKPVTHIVEQLLNQTNIKVAVYTGQLDLIVDTPGTVIWVDNLRWTKSSQWPNTPRTAITVDNINEGYVKKLGNFGLYWINRAGHMVPADNPAGMNAILRDLTNNYDGNAKRN